jgi:hypothetical protein
MSNKELDATPPAAAIADAPVRVPKPIRTYEAVAEDFLNAVVALEKVLREMHERTDVMLQMEMIAKANTGDATYFNYRLWKQTHAKHTFQWKIVDQGGPKGSAEGASVPTPVGGAVSPDPIDGGEVG